MQAAQRILCNGFPRTVAAGENGSLKQHFVHSESEFDLYFEHNRPNLNVYMNIARFREDMRSVTGDIPFDFDAPMKDSAFSEDITDKQKIDRMREDEQLAEKILGPVWDDVRALVRQCREKKIPVISVFSGLGVHCHMLFQERVNPTKEKITTSKHFVDELGLETYDRQIITDTRRVLRVPNSQRIEYGEPCGVWCIPMTEDEVLHNSLHDVLERSTSPKSIGYHDRYREANRPQMQVYEEINRDEDAVGSVPLEERDIDSTVPENIAYIVRSCIPLPCVRERFLQSNPSHMIRFSGVVWLFQAGFRPSEVRGIIRRIGWVDYDEHETKRQVNSVWKNRYSELSCSSLQTLGLCVHGPGFDSFSNDPSDCETHRYHSGKALYPHE